MTINAKDELEISLYTLMERALMLAYPNGVVDSSTRQQMIADSNPGYPITSDQGIGPSIIRSDLVETPSVPIGTYPIYTPSPLADGSDPDNLLGNFVQDTVGFVYPTQDRYVQTPVKHLTVARGPVDQRWEIMVDSQIEYSALIRSKLNWVTPPSIAFIQRTPAGLIPPGANTYGVTSFNMSAFPGNTGVGNLIVAIIGHSYTDNQLQITDTQSNLWYIDHSQQDGAYNHYFTVAHTYATAATQMVITVASAGNNSCWLQGSAMEFSGIMAGLTAGASGHNGSPAAGDWQAEVSSGNVNPSGTTALYIGGFLWTWDSGGNLTFTVGAEWTQTMYQNTHLYGDNVAGGYLISSGAHSYNGMLSGPYDWAATVVAFNITT